MKSYLKAQTSSRSDVLLDIYSYCHQVLSYSKVGSIPVLSFSQLDDMYYCYVLQRRAGMLLKVDEYEKAKAIYLEVMKRYGKIMLLVECESEDNSTNTHQAFEKLGFTGNRIFLSLSLSPLRQDGRSLCKSERKHVFFFFFYFPHRWNPPYAKLLAHRASILPMPRYTRAWIMYTVERIVCCAAK